jgi:hypothetical protein
LRNGGAFAGSNNPEAKNEFYVVILGALVLTTLFTVRSVFRFVANFNGVVVDLNKGIIAYPGGGVVRNNFSDLFRLRFLAQTCYRFVTQLDQIRMVEPRNTTVTSQTGGGFAGGVAAGLNAPITPQTVQRTYYRLEFNGAFGAVTLSFNSEGKRDEVYSFIRQYQQMGVPVLQA